MKDDAMADAKERQDFCAEEREREDGMDALRQGFMKPVVYEGGYYEVETDCGTEIVPADLIGNHSAASVDELTDYLEGNPSSQDEVPVQHGWLARMSASGYTDCTSWEAHATKEAAEDSLIANYLED